MEHSDRNGRAVRPRYTPALLLILVAGLTARRLRRLPALLLILVTVPFVSCLDTDAVERQAYDFVCRELAGICPEPPPLPRVLYGTEPGMPWPDDEETAACYHREQGVIHVHPDWRTRMAASHPELRNRPRQLLTALLVHEMSHHFCCLRRPGLPITFDEMIASYLEIMALPERARCRFLARNADFRFRHRRQCRLLVYAVDPTGFVAACYAYLAEDPSRLPAVAALRGDEGSVAFEAAKFR